MVKYKVRSFYERDTGTAGADVVIFDDTGDVVDTILITTESTYNDLVSQLQGLDERYVDRQEVLDIIQNNIYSSDEIVEINATLLDGHSSDYYARREHNHDTLYAPLSHASILSTTDINGHTKIINNLSKTAYQEGEALAAYQGKVLDDKINTQSNTLNNKINSDISTVNEKISTTNNNVSSLQSSLNSTKTSLTNKINSEVNTLNNRIDTIASQQSSSGQPSTHSHGQISYTGTINSDLSSSSTVNKILVTDSSNNIKTLSKLPASKVTHQDISGKENTSNKVTSISSSSTNTQYPSAKLLYDQLATKASTSSVNAITNNNTNTVNFTNAITTMGGSGSGLIRNGFAYVRFNVQWPVAAISSGQYLVRTSDTRFKPAMVTEVPCKMYALSDGKEKIASIIVDYDSSYGVLYKWYGDNSNLAANMGIVAAFSYPIQNY